MTKKVFSLTSDFTVKSVNDGDNSITIEGYANTTEKDRMGDVILREAWEKGGLDNYLNNPVVLAFHDHTKPIGTVVDHTVTDKGLKVTAKIFKAADTVFSLIKEGILKTFSVGFRVKDAEYDQITDIFVIKDLELFEISVVSVPANTGSIFSVKKAFDNEEDLEEFKKEFTPEEETNDSPSEEVNLSEDLKEALETKLKELEENIISSVSKSHTKEEKIDMSEPAVGKEMVEELLVEAEKRITKQFEEKEETLSKALEDIKGELLEKSAELEALQKNKMSFEHEAPVRLEKDEIDAAILLSKSLGRKVEDTNFGSSLIQKAGLGPHLSTTTATWEEEFSTRLESDIRESLVLEPMFRKITMNAGSMHIPVNPEAGYGEWIANTYPPLRSTDGSSTGTAQDHKITDRTLTAYKLAAKEYLGDEEEEDAILPLMPIVRDAVVRRVAKAADRALLRGDAGIATGDGDTYPFNGVATIASDAGASTTLSIGAGDKVTVSSLQSARRNLGVWGLDPSKLIYVVSHDAYFDLLDDPDFRTMDVVGSNATIIKGQIGSANGSPIVVSGEFGSKAASAPAVVCVNAANFIVGQLRNTRVETERSVVNQSNILVATRRMGFIDIVAGKGASVISWAA